MNEIGITSYGVAIPRRRLDVNEIADLWMNLEKGVVTNKWGMKERTVLAQDEDSTTLAVAAAKEAFLRNEKAKEVEALYYGTCTNPYDSRPSGTIVLEALDLPYSTKCTDVQFSTKSGTAALLESYAMVKAGLAKQALAIGTDTIDRHTAPAIQALLLRSSDLQKFWRKQKREIRFSLFPMASAQAPTLFLLPLPKISRKSAARAKPLMNTSATRQCSTIRWR